MKITVAALGLLALSGIAAADVVSPGFEQGPAVSEIRFSPTDTDGLGWFASNTDGERFQATGAKPAAEGEYYASLLQNGGAYDGAPLGVGDFGFTGFDRIYAEFDVLPNTQYTISFMHASDDRFGYVAATSVVEIVDVGNNATLDQRMFATPGFFQWTGESFSFTTGATTTTAAVAFTVMGSINASGVFDAVSITPAPGSLALLGLGGLAMARRRR
ncbi:MAG: MYXO-CTERM sorting domain-containing protein [Phycisphaerales bacterium JB037]